MKIYDLGKEPISDDQPAGIDVLYDEDYEQLVVEIKKLSSPTADSAIDWSRVTGLCQKILAEESKNILVACFLCVALGHTGGLKGCATGIHVLRELLDNFWNTLYPPKKRKKGRINALTWWNDNLKNLLEGVEAETWESAERQELIDDISALDSFIGENLPDGPILRPLIELLTGLILEPENQVEQEPAPESGPEPVPTAPPADEPEPATPHTANAKHSGSAPPPRVDKTSIPATDSGAEGTDADEFFAAGLDYLAQSATKLFSKDSSRPISYQINRLAAWSQIDTLPPASNGKTMLPAPDGQLINLLNGQYESKMWPELLTTAEGHVRQYLFWLDLSYWVSTALEQLRARIASLTVAYDTLLYSSRLNPIETLRFEDGTPFAGDETREWLATMGSSSSATSTATVSDQNDELTAQQAEAMQILSDTGLQDALQFFCASNRPQGRGEKESFLRDLTLCKLMLKGRKAELALPFAERLIAMVEARALESWEPDLALTAMLIACKCFKQAKREGFEKQVEQLQERIILLAPEKAINII